MEANTNLKDKMSRKCARKNKVLMEELYQPALKDWHSKLPITIGRMIYDSWRSFLQYR